MLQGVLLYIPNCVTHVLSTDPQEAAEMVPVEYTRPVIEHAQQMLAPNMQEIPTEHKKLQDIFLSRQHDKVNVSKLQEKQGTWTSQDDGSTRILCPLCDTSLNASEVAAEGTLGARWRKYSPE